jgi:hypothetical protein
MSLYLAELAPPDVYDLDPVQAGRLLVLYKRELRWAVPCMPFGSFALPDKSWVTRNYKKYRIWLDTERSPVAAASDNCLIWVGFMPVAGDAYPDPPEVATSYPTTLVEEIGAWRTVRTSEEDAEKYELFKVAPDGTPTLAQRADGQGSTLELVAQNATVSTPDGNIYLGVGADEPGALGNVLQTKLEALCDKISTGLDDTLNIVVPTAWGPSGPVSAGPAAGALTALKSDVATLKSTLADIKSTFIFLKKDPA